MIVVDTSAIIAVLYREPEFDQFSRLLTEAASCSLSAVSYCEAAMVLIGRSTPEASKELDSFLAQMEMEVVPFDHQLAIRARDAFVRFGKGRHPARLNFGDWYPTPWHKRVAFRCCIRARISPRRTWSARCVDRLLARSAFEE